MTHQEMWKRYAEIEGISAPYEAWAYGEAADELAALTLAGIKTATASAYPLYESEGEELPKAGAYSVILNSAEEAVCIIRTERVFVVPFESVDERQAWKEGEKDRTLACWRRVHEEFFSREMAKAGMEFSWKMKVVCEEFTRVYP